MADRVAIFNEGKIVQAGTPKEIYEYPRTKFTADFVGSSNVLSPEFSAKHGGPKNWCSLRPEKIVISPKGVKAKITSVNYQGATTRIVVDLDGTHITAALPASDSKYTIGEVIKISWSRTSLAIMEAE